MLVVLSSATSAQRLKKLLASSAISSEVIQTPASLSNGGCSYSVRIKDSLYKEVLTHITKLHINVKGIYQEQLRDKNMTYIKKG